MRSLNMDLKQICHRRKNQENVAEPKMDLFSSSIRRNSCPYQSVELWFIGITQLHHTFGSVIWVMFLIDSGPLFIDAACAGKAHESRIEFG